MFRRDLLAGAAAGATAAALPRFAIAQPAAARTLKYVPHANIPNIDPFTNTAFIGLVKVTSFQLGFWHASQFPMIAVVMTVVAISGAVLMKRYLLPLVPPLDRITT